MRLYEYQAKELFAEAGIPVPRGRVAGSPAEAREIASELATRVVIKAQVPIGGRGKAGGVRLAATPAEAEKVAEQILALRIRDYPVHRLLVEEAAEITQEYYLSLTVDRSRNAAVVIASAAGGMEIEEIAAQHPDKVAKVWLDAALGLREYVVRSVLRKAGFSREHGSALAGVLRRLHSLFRKYDAMLVEINPLVITGDGRVVALDGKIEIDDNAMYRHPELERFREESETEHELERRARSLGLAYVKLDGEVGIIGNGAGLVMTTLDMIQRNGGRPANFLDIGGGAKAEVVRNALQIVLGDPSVKSVLINVFGGITRGDEVARGLLSVLESMEVTVPIVVRLAGTRAREGLELLQGSRLVTAETFQEAARKAVELAKAR